MKMKFKTIEQGIEYALKNDLPSFEVGGLTYYVDDVDDMSEYDGELIYQDGGYTKYSHNGYANTNNMNPIKELLHFKHGGSVFNKDLVANEESKAKSYLPLQPFIPIQTELKETIVLPTGDLVKVNATKRHSKMKDDEVTDMVPENSYILSMFGDTKIYKEEADQIPLEIKAEPYNIHRASKVPVTKTLGDIMTKNVMSPADLSRTVMNKFKIVEGSDPFTVQTNASNKFNRTAYLQAIIGLSEFDKARKGIDNSIETQMSPQMVARDGGKVRMGYSVPKAIEPFSAILAAIPGIAGIFTNIADRRRLKKNTALNDADISTYRSDTSDKLKAGTIGNLVSNELQETEVTPVTYGSQYLDSANSNNMAFLNNASRRISADAFNNRMDTSSMTPQMAMLFGERDNAQRYDALNKGASELAATRADLFSKYMSARQSVFDANTKSRVDARNASQAGRNQQRAIRGGIFSGYTDNLINLEGNVLSSRMANRGNYAANISTLNSSLAQTLQNSANVGLQMYTQSQAQALEKEMANRANYQKNNPNLPPNINRGIPPVQSSTVDCRFGINIWTGLPC